MNNNRNNRGERGGRGGRGQRQRQRDSFRPVNPPEPRMMEEKWQNPLSSQQKKYILSRFPTQNIKLSYETVAPKKVLSEEYDLCVAIPYGKKAYLWYTFCNEYSVCLLLELNRENQLNDNISILPTYQIPKDFELGTIVSGTIYEENEVEEVNPPIKYFIVDDIHVYKGITISTKLFSFKSGYLYDFFLQSYNDKSKIALAVLWNSNNTSNEKKYDNIPYNFRHIQYRSTNQILPHYNVSNIKKFLDIKFLDITEIERPVEKPIKPKYIINTNWKFDFSKPIYKQNVYFYVKADLAFDVYYLGALSKTKDIIYCQNALVLNFKTSVLLNTIFRKIKENQCLDSIEDSDDETEFEDVREDKLVDLNKECIMECYFHFKFKKWVPIQIVSTNSKIVLLPSLL